MTIETNEGLFMAVETLLPHAMARERWAATRRLEHLRRAKHTAAIRRDPTQELERLERILRQSAERRAKRSERLPQPACPSHLPIAARQHGIMAAIRRHPVVIISGETGSGKSTQIPKFCLAAGRGIDGLIGHTQPRRIAAQAVARRIAEEMGQVLGQAVGYKIRFQDATPAEAYIKVMTDGILLAEIRGDRLLSAYDTLIVDEAHERSLNIDFLLGYLRTLLRRRQDLKVIITSATIDTQKFAEAFNGAPVIEVSGRLYPVDLRYLETGEGEEPDRTHIELAVRAVRGLHQERPGGDILVFMPTEQDIRETCETVAGSILPGTQVMPLFARLTAAEQSRVFRPGPGRRVIVATNVAETSLTIPGIRYVVDTGLARILRYSPRTRTTSLPVAPISRSSADQRAGRCGRTAAGACIRLYTEADYLSRPQYTPPEILRANLADVILRMLSIGLGDISDFPFIDRPEAKAISDGFNLLSELGAIRDSEVRKPDGGRRMAAGAKAVELTDTGRIMARIPLDPRLSRILIEARNQGCVEEIAVIAAALSIQDPRERPAEKTAEADQAHSTFVDPSSDFLTLLNIWKRYHQARKQAGSAGALKRFCHEYFLSYRRMREWEDIHQQIEEILKEFGIRKAENGRGGTTGTAEGAGGDPLIPQKRKGSSAFPLPPLVSSKVHRSILSGFLSNIAFKKEKNLYRATKGREVLIFPGSGLFNSAGAWIMAAEMVETTRLFARTVATIDPNWLEPAGGSLCRSTYTDARWDSRRGEVIATEQVTLFGLTIVRGRSVSYGTVKPAEANEIFIRQALVAGDLEKPMAFLKHNQELAAGVRDLEDRLRRRDLLVGEEELAVFYRERLPGVYDLNSLRRLIRAQGGDTFLRMRKEHLMRYRPEPGELALFPEQAQAAGHTWDLSYRFEPGADADGVTLRVPPTAASQLPASVLEWLVPGLLKQKVEILLKALPKALRMRLAPLRDTVEIIMDEMPQGGGPLPLALSDFIRSRFGVEIPAGAWPLQALPDHLRMRYAITAGDGRELVAGRDPAILRTQAAMDPIPAEVRQRWERSGVTRWDFGDLPEVLNAPAGAREAWVAYPGLQAGTEDIRLKLFARRDQAEAAHARGVAALLALRFEHDLKLAKRGLALPDELHPAARHFGGSRRVESAVIERVVHDLFEADIRSAREFDERAAAGASRLLPAVRELFYAVIPIIEIYAAARGDLAALSESSGPLAGFRSAMEDELSRLVPQHFIELYERSRLPHLERYLQALRLRVRRAALDLEKDRTKAAGVAPYTRKLNRLLQSLSPASPAARRQAIEELFWLIEEYKISVFAQELKTARPVSPKRLEQKIAEIERMA